MRSNRLAIAITLATVASLASTATLKAQAQKPLITTQALIAVVENHKGAVLKFIDVAPDSMLGFRPTKGVRSFAEQIEHAAGSDALIAHLAITGTMKVPSLGDSAVYLHNKAALRKYAIAAMDHTIQMLKGVSEASLTESIDMFGNKVARGRGLMELLDHFPFTLGQVVPYLRLNGVKPPTYSPF